MRLQTKISSTERTPSGGCQPIGETILPPFGLATSQLAYDKPVPNCAVAETYERFGNSRPKPDFKASYLAAPRLILSEAMCEIIKGERSVEVRPSHNPS